MVGLCRGARSEIVWVKSGAQKYAPIYCEFFEHLDEELTEEDGLHLNDDGKKYCCEMIEEIITDFKKSSPD